MSWDPLGGGPWVSGECVRGEVGECRASWLVCGSGLLEGLGGRVEGFGSLKVGAVNTSVDLEGGVVRYVYLDEAGGGFYLEADITAPDRPECAGQLMSALLVNGRRLLSGRPGWRVAEFIVSTRMFPGARL